MRITVENLNNEIQRIIYAARTLDINELQGIQAEGIRLSEDLIIDAVGPTIPAAILAINGEREAAEFLRNCDSETDIDWVAEGAAIGGDRTYAEELVRRGAKIIMVACGAALGGHTRWAEELRNAYALPINVIAESAARGGNMDYTRTLLRLGADINQITEGVLLIGPNIRILQELQNMGADIDAVIIGLIKASRADAVCWAQEHLGVDIEAIARHFIVGRNTETEYYERLRNLGADLDKVALQMISEGYLISFRILDAMGVDINHVANFAAQNGMQDYAMALCDLQLQNQDQPSEQYGEEAVSVANYASRVQSQDTQQSWQERINSARHSHHNVHSK